ncbi:rhodanese [Prochlorococcus sp. AH-736-K20]|nr:rhodanese-like domain-containing protein [Prochlorococcus sp. AH-736-K20]MDA9746443.1 rhodanese [Prochlorococcus sp. AH-736-K20]
MGSFPKSINAYSLNDWFNSEKEDPVLIDVREQSELKIASFSREFFHIPISKVTFEYVEEIFAGLLEKEIVVSCHAGIRSYNFCQWCLDNNIVREIWNLEEGIDGWSRDIDPSIQRY